VSRRTLLAGIAALTALLGAAPPSLAGPSAEAGRAAPATSTASSQAPAPTSRESLLQALLDMNVLDEADQPGPAPGGVVAAPSDHRYGGEWNATNSDGEQIRVLGLVGPTEEDRAAVARAAEEAGIEVAVEDVDSSAGTLLTARDAVAERLRALGAGDFSVEVEPQRNRVMAHIETEGPMAHAIAAQMREAAEAATASLPDGMPEVAVAIESDVSVEPIQPAAAGAADVVSPTAFPPYDPGLWVDVTSPTMLYQCTSAYTFTRGGERLGSTAGHCGDVGSQVAGGPNASVSVGTVVANGFYPGQEVRSDLALHSLPPGIPAGSDVPGGPAGERSVETSMADAEITYGTNLCFAGRASGVEQCGPVNAIERYTCCDATERAFVFDCIDRVARAGDSGGPVYQPIGDRQARAAGLLSSSVDINGRSSMCFTTIDDAAREFGAAFTPG
jgi:hypothetical protein